MQSQGTRQLVTDHLVISAIALAATVSALTLVVTLALTGALPALREDADTGIASQTNPVENVQSNAPAYVIPETSESHPLTGLPVSSDATGLSASTSSESVHPLTGLSMIGTGEEAGAVTEGSGGDRHPVTGLPMR
jgi:hypothetical protein